MQVKTLTLFVFLCFLCFGCASEQWVKEYVKGETAGLQEALSKHEAVSKQETLSKQEALIQHMADVDKRQEELLKRHTSLENQITKMLASLEVMDKKLTECQESVGRFSEEVMPLEEILNLRSEVEDKFAKLEEVEKNLSLLRESGRADTLATDKSLAALAAQLNDAKRFVDMNVTEVLKAQNRLKEYIIEEVRLLKVENQEYAKELETVKSRLQTLESAVGEKKPQGEYTLNR